MTVRLRHSTDKDGTPRATWTVDVSVRQPNGLTKRVQLKSPVQTKPGAQRYERQLAESLREGSFGVEKKRLPTLGEFAPRYLEWSKANNKPSTYRGKELCFSNRLLPLYGHLRLDEITTEHFDRLKASMVAEGLKAKTQASALGIFVKCLRVAVEWEILEKAPHVHFPKFVQQEAEWLDVEEARAFLAAAAYWPERYPFLLLALDTGMRVGELMGLQWADVDLERRRLIVRRTRVLVTKGYGTPKSGKPRSIDLTARCLEALRSIRHLKSEYVFLNVHGKPLSHNTVNSWAPAACKRAGLPKRIQMHGLRHTCCAFMTMAGVDEASMLAHFGWGSGTFLRRYTHLSPSFVRQAIDKLEAFDRLHSGKKKEKEETA